MGIIGGRPPEKGSITNWKTFSVPRKASVEGWVAGDAVCVHCHDQRGSKICLKRYLHPNAECDGCNRNVRLDWLYYLPWYRQPDYRPVISIFHQDMASVLDRLTKHQHVKIGRLDEDNAPHYCNPILKPEKFDTISAEKRNQQDISDYLPVLWSFRGLVTGEMVRRGPLDGSSKPTTVPSIADEPDKRPDGFGVIPPRPPLKTEAQERAELKYKEFLDTVGKEVPVPVGMKPHKNGKPR